MVGNTRQHRGDDTQFFVRIGRDRVPRDGVLGLDMQPVQVRHHADYRLAGFLLQPVQSGLQQRNIAAKTVDDEADDAVALRGRQQRQRTDDMCKHAATINVRDQQHRHVCFLGKPHVGDVVGAQVDFSRAAGAFANQAIVLRRQPLPGIHDRMHRRGFVGVIGPGFQIEARLALYDHLRPLVGGRLQQHRVHVGMRFQTAGLRLHCLCPADLSSIHRDSRIQRHVLRLERRDADPPAVQYPAQSGGQRAFTGVGSRSLDHQCFHSTIIP